MRRLFLLLILLLAIASPAIAQSTLVSATVTDADGTPWASGTYIFTSAAYPTVAIISGTLDSTGSFTSITFPTNNATSGVGGRWTARICPLVTAPCFATIVTIPGGATQSLSSNLSPPAIRIAASSQPPVTAYANVEITGAIQGSRYFNVTDSTEHVCKALPCSSNWQSTPSNGGVLLTKQFENTNWYADQYCSIGTPLDVGLCINNTIAAMPTVGSYLYGTIRLDGFTPGTAWVWNTPVTINSPGVSIIGPGSELLQINAATLTSDHLRINTSPFIVTQAGKFGGFALIGGSQANAVCLHIGDIIGPKLEDLQTLANASP